MARKKRKSTIIAVGFQMESFAKASARQKFGKDIDFEFIKSKKKPKR